MPLKIGATLRVPVSVISVGHVLQKSAYFLEDTRRHRHTHARLPAHRAVSPFCFHHARSRRDHSRQLPPREGASKRATTYSELASDLGEGVSARSSWTRATKLVLGTAAVAGIVGTAFAARGAFVSRPSLGAQQAADIATLPEGFQTALLGYKFAPGEIGEQTFLTDNLVPQGGCDFELCGAHEYDVGIFSFVDNCLGGGSGCVGLTSGCRHCTINPEQVGTPREWLPACPKCICEEHELDPSLCSSEPSPVAPPSPDAPSPPSPPDAPSLPPPPAVLQSFRTVEIPGINDGIESSKTWKFRDAVFGPDNTTLYFIPYVNYVGTTPRPIP